ncbi:disease resistance protein RPV1 [Lactuca sativa]|uniref:disease resistance protein RPV1 n=1 Tax=Lactuca sativa TaxID=4236 RepID=UPI000CB79903|nr:disease resistance protein RPV1 [Lactuca sativa]
MVILSDTEGGSSSSSSPIDGHMYDVLLTFNGTDSRYSFPYHLYKALWAAKITTRFDNKQFQIGARLKLESETLTKTYRVSLILLSENYANSRWCLEELVLILEQCSTSNHTVLPIYYYVEPSDVREQQGSFGDAMARYRQEMEGETDANKKSQLAEKIEQCSPYVFQ